MAVLVLCPSPERFVCLLCPALPLRSCVHLHLSMLALLCLAHLCLMWCSPTYTRRKAPKLKHALSLGDFQSEAAPSVQILSAVVLRASARALLQCSSPSEAKVLFKQVDKAFNDVKRARQQLKNCVDRL